MKTYKVTLSYSQISTATVKIKAKNAELAHEKASHLEPDLIKFNPQCGEITVIGVERI